MKTLLSVSVLLLVFSFTAVPTAQACSCIAPSAPLVELGKSDAVFQGRVTRMTRVGNEWGGEDIAVQFEVRRQWKGVDERQIIVLTATNTAACGYPFEKGGEYVVYASTYGDESQMLGTSICTRTASLDNALEDVMELGDGEIFENHRGCGSPFGATVVQTFMWVGLAVMMRRRRPGTLPDSRG